MERSKLTPLRRASAGFTLIELLVVAGITSILMLTVSSMFMTFMLSNARTNVRRQLQVEGSNAISRVEFLIRNAKDVNSTAGTCTGANSAGIIITDQTDATITIQRNSSTNRLTETVGATATDLTANSVLPANPVFNCSVDSKGSKYVSVSFTLQRPNTIDSSNLTQSFSTVVQVRNTAF